MGAPRPIFNRWVLVALCAAACGTTGTSPATRRAGGGAICGLAPGIPTEMLRTEEVMVRLVDHGNDAPLAGMALQLRSGNEALGPLECATRTDDYGIARARVVPGLYNLSLPGRPDLVARTHAFYTADNEPREIRVELGGTISGRVLDDRGQPIARVAVTVGGEDGLATSQTDASGAFRCERLWSGEHTVSVVVDTRASLTRTVLRPPGEDVRDVNLTLVPGAVLIVRATCGGPCVGATVSARIGDEVREEQVGPDGIARLRDLPAGPIRLHGYRDDARGRLRATTGVNLQAGRTVNATLELGRKRN